MDVGGRALSGLPYYQLVAQIAVTHQLGSIPFCPDAGSNLPTRQGLQMDTVFDHLVVADAAELVDTQLGLTLEEAGVGKRDRRLKLAVKVSGLEPFEVGVFNAV